MRITIDPNDSFVMNQIPDQLKLNFTKLKINSPTPVSEKDIIKVALTAFQAQACVNYKKAFHAVNENSRNSAVKDSADLSNRKITWELKSTNGFVLSSNDVAQSSFPDPYKNDSYYQRMNEYSTYPMDSKEYKEHQEFSRQKAEEWYNSMANQNMDNFN